MWYDRQWKCNGDSSTGACKEMGGRGTESGHLERGALVLSDDWVEACTRDKI